MSLPTKVRSSSLNAPKPMSSDRTDLIIIVLLVVLASAITFLAGQMVDPVLLKEFTEDVWFGSDIERVFSNMSNRFAPNSRARVHPIFALLVFPFVKAIQVVTRSTPEMAVLLVMTGTTALWVGLLYVTLRLMGCRRLDAAVFSVLGLSSAAIIFWATVPETYLFGSLSLLVPLFFVALAQTRRLPIWSYVLMSAFSLSITTTNWMAGIFATVVTSTRKWTIAITGLALALVLLLWSVQSRLFRGTTFITDIAGEKNYALPGTAGGPIRVILGLFFHPMVMPGIQVIPSNRNQPEWSMLTVQHAQPGSGSVLWGVEVGLWAALLVLGAIACWKLKQNRQLRLVIGLTLLGQLALHLLYGEETFLYAMHLIPFLIVVAAMATLTRQRSLVLGLAILLIVFAGLNNGRQFFQATEFLKHRGPLREKVPAVQSTPSPMSLPSVFLDPS